MPRAKNLSPNYLEPHKAGEVDVRQRQADFLMAFVRYKNEYKAASTLTINGETIRYWRRTDEWFRAAYEDAAASVAGEVLDAVIARAVTGWTEPMVSGGQVVYDVDHATGKRYKVMKFRYDSMLLQKLASYRIPGFARSSGEPGSRSDDAPAPGTLPEGYTAISNEDFALLNPILRQLKDRQALAAEVPE